MDYGRLATPTQTLTEQPVFATADGRRRRSPRWLGRAFAISLTAWLASVVAGGSGFAALPPLPTSLAMRPAVARLDTSATQDVALSALHPHSAPAAARIDRHLARDHRARA